MWSLRLCIMVLGNLSFRGFWSRGSRPMFLRTWGIWGLNVEDIGYTGFQGEESGVPHPPLHNRPCDNHLASSACLGTGRWGSPAQSRGCQKGRTPGAEAQRGWATGPGSHREAHLDERVVDLHVRLDEAPAAHHDVLGAARRLHAAQQQQHHSDGDRHGARRPSTPARPHGPDASWPDPQQAARPAPHSARTLPAPSSSQPH